MDKWCASFHEHQFEIVVTLDKRKCSEFSVIEFQRKTIVCYEPISKSVAEDLFWKKKIQTMPNVLQNPRIK